MTDFSSLLQLDKEVLTTLVNAYSSYATYLDEGQSDDLQTIAGSYMKAAGYVMFYDQAAAREWFSRARDYYTRAADTYGIIAAICCHQAPDMEAGPSPTPDLQFYQLLCSYFKDVPVDITAYQEPVGRLQVPIRLYMEAFESTEEAVQAADLPAAWKPLLTRMHTRPRLLSKDTRRWHSLEGTINPIEPETIATCVTLLTVAQRQGITRESMEEMLQQQKDAAFIAVRLALLLSHSTPPPHTGYNHS
ncbi:hypothetical protein HHL17_11915 [Chitinophaga sp. G-6-1-13]|uniref:Uncharacterized protein n=1 Tax=Chitinophaga fulva TaxID=2728842 RepID=A0A848GJP5_9BACT|nr:hypothetical protein [Chitinophaga fulva]NML37901.1 hypothetical protein [Chitinophaga fulva]